jgi:hypothetical protein
MLYVVFQSLRERSGSLTLRYKWPQFKRMSSK